MSAGEDRGRWLYGSEGKCSTRSDAPPGRPLRAVLLGAPGAGKGTQAERISREYQSCQLSTGDVFRAALCRAASELGDAMKEALESIQKGELASDSTVIDLVRERVDCLTCAYGFLLDGFPRTAPQAEALDELLAEREVALDIVLDYRVPIEEVVARLGGRRTCRRCKRTYHLASKPPKSEGVCDRCGGEIFRRDDDRPDSIRVRLRAYEESTAPLSAYYEANGLLRTISAEGSPEVVFERTRAAIEERLATA